MSSATAVADLKCMEDVLKTYCSHHIQQMYTTSDQDGRSKILLALKSLLEVMRQHSFFKSPPMTPENPKAITKDLDPVLTRALKSLGGKTIMEDYHDLKIRLKSWGMPKPFFVAVMEHHQSIEKFKRLDATKKDGYMNLYQTSQAVTKNAENVDFTILEKIFIRDLKLFQTSTCKFLEGKIATPPSLSTGLYTFIQDDNGDYVWLALYNMVTSGPMRWEIAERKFPVGMKIKISQPFYKIFSDGNPGIRVDSPAEIYRDIPNSQLTVDEVRSRGKELMKAGEYFEALELYLEGLKTTQIEALLNNRSLAEIKLEQYEEALLDAASVLLFSNNAKTNQRYTTAAQKLGFNKDDKTSVFSVWKHVLQHQRKDECLHDNGTKERGNEAFKLGNYEEAKKNYSSALKDSEACVLLNNIAVVCLKLDLFHTAISAASACLQMSTQAQVRGKAHYSMAKALTLLGVIDLSKLSVECDPTLDKFWREEMSKIWETVLEPTKKVCLDYFYDPTYHTWDFIESDAIEHDYVLGRGRGLRAKRNIDSKEPLLLDHIIGVEGIKIEQSHAMSLSMSRTGSIDNKSHMDLVTKILTLVKHDGILGNKISSLESRGNLDKESLPLIDLEWMAYRKFSHDVPPFLPQTPEVVGCDMTNLTEPFIDKVVSINTFGDGDGIASLFGGARLFLRISLLNHDENPNCVVLENPNASALVLTSRRIRKGEELTISYGPTGIDTKKWGF